MRPDSMPQITLEYSANVQPGVALSELFAGIHRILSTVGKINIGNCKSRAYVANEYRIGAGEDNLGFVHLEVRFLEGRDKALVRSLGSQLLQLLKAGFAEASARLDLQITVEIQDIERAGYFKFPDGTFTAQAGKQ